jgi:hypothetical protein
MGVSKHGQVEGGWGDLAEAARALEHELQRFEDLANAARRMPLDSHKAIERAAKAATETVAGQGRVDLALGALVRVITTVRERHEANVAAVQARGEEIRLRADQLGPLLERQAALAEEGRTINQLVQAAAEQQRAATTPEGIRALVTVVLGIEERMSKLVEGARELVQAATSASMADVAGQADSLRQQVAAARNKLALLRKSLQAQVPDPSQLN